MSIFAPDANSPIVDDAGNMVQRFRTWTRALTRVVPFEGVGSPEGVVEALPTQTYMDTSGIAGAIMYVKRDADIAGDKTKGWILI